MNSPALLSPPRRAKRDAFAGAQKPVKSLRKSAGLILLLLSLWGCAAKALLSEKEQAAVKAGGKVIVLLRVRCTIDNQQVAPFINPSLTADPIVYLGLGSFESVGEPRFAGQRYLSEESRRAGWAYFVLSPEIYYLAVIGPDSSSTARASDSQYFLKAPRWRIDVPAQTRLLYAGTIEIGGKYDGALLFGGKIVTPLDSEQATVTDEHAQAQTLLAEHFPAAGEMKTLLMQRWHEGEPIIIRSPWPPRDNVED